MQQVHNAAVVARSLRLGCQCDRDTEIPGGVREILPYPSTLVGYPPPSFLLSYSDTFKRNHERTSYYLKFSANPLREHVKFLSRHTRWVAGSSALSAYRFLQVMGPQSWRSWKRPPYLSILIMTAWLHSTVALDNVQPFVILSR